MLTLFDIPRPGQVCPCCGLAVPVIPALRVGRNHPETSHAAVEVANKRANVRHAEALARLKAAGADGMTDDEMDEATGWGHQCTTPVMNALRTSRLVAWIQTVPGVYRHRLTRKGNPARVNVLAEFLPRAGMGDLQ